MTKEDKEKCDFIKLDPVQAMLMMAMNLRFWSW